MVRPGAFFFYTDAPRHSQESQLDSREQLSLERLGAKTVGRDLELKQITDSDANQVLKGTTFRIRVRSLIVLQDGLVQNLVNTSIW